MKKEKALIVSILKEERKNIQDISWSKFLKISRTNGLDSMLYKNIKSLEIKVPSQVMKVLESFYNENVRRNLLFMKELRSISSKNKELILIKGFATLEMTSQDIRDRYMSDIDILEINNTEKLVRKLRELGYESEQKYPKSFYRRNFRHLPPMTKKTNNHKIIVEIHNSLEETNSPFRIPIEELSFTQKEFEGIRYKTLKAEESLIYMCLQTSYDNFFVLGVRNIFDLHKLITNHDIDWKKVMNKSQKWDCNSFVYKTLIMSKVFFDTKIPIKVLEFFKEHSKSYELLLLRSAQKNLLTTKSKNILNFNKWILRIMLGRNIKQKTKLSLAALSFFFFRVKKQYG